MYLNPSFLNKLNNNKGHVGVLKNIEDMKMTRISVDSPNGHMKTEQIHEVLNNVSIVFHIFHNFNFLYALYYV